MAGSIQTVVHQVALLVAGVSGFSNSTVFEYWRPLNTPDQFPFAVVWESGQREERHALGGTVGGGRKWVHHEISIQIHTISLNPSSAADWQTFEDLLDAIKGALRINQTLSGLTRRFGEDLSVDIDQPNAADSVLHFNAVLTAPAIEEITA